MKKLTTIACALGAFTSSLLTINFAQADSAQSLAEYQQVKNLPAGAIPTGVKLSTDQNYRGLIDDNPTSFDPQVISDHISVTCLSPVFDTLIRQAENGKYVLDAAQSYDVSKDGKTWTFHLRKDAKWQDGNPVTAQDFVYSFQRLTDPKTGSPYESYLAIAHVVNAQQIIDGKLPVTALGVKALDDYTFEVSLSIPTPWLPQMLAYQATAPLRKDLITKYGDAWASPKNLVGNGPFKLSEYKVNDELTYTKWDNYWNAKNIHLTSITYNVIKNDNTAYLKYLSGALDFTFLPASALDKVTKERPNEVVVAPLKASGYIDFKYTQVPYAVRHAVALLIDSKYLTSKVLKNNIPTSIFVPNFIQDAQGTTEADYYNEDIKQRRVKAIKELDAAGITPQNPFTITVLFQNNVAGNLASNALRAWIQKATNGRIIYKANLQEPKTFFAKSINQDYQVRYTGWGSDYDQASAFYNVLVCGDPNNHGAYCNPEYDKLINTANNTLDVNKRVALYQQANKLIQKDLPVVPLFWYTELHLRNPRLGGYNPEVYPTVVRDLYIKDINIK